MRSNREFAKVVEDWKNFLQENNASFRAWVPRILFWFGLTAMVWMYDVQGLTDFPLHWLPEWVSIFYMGCFVAAFKGSLISRRKIVGITSLSLMIFVVSDAGPSWYSLVISLLFLAPFIIGYFYRESRC